MDTADIRRIIVGRIPPGQITLYRALYFADQPLTINSVAHMIREGDVESTWGVIRALSTRIGDATSKSPKYEAFFEVETKDGTRYFRMRPEVREAIESIPELLDVMKWPVRKIFARYDHGEDHWLVVE
ncbi:MAG: hypothetical protein ACOC58_03390 [Chloroflexota bacterium]